MVTRRRMTDEELLQHLREQLRRSAGFESDKFASDRETAWNYYFQRPRGDEVEGRSQVVSGDLSSMAEATLSQMMKAFSSDRIAEFQALDVFDEDQAQLESETVQRLIMQGSNNGFMQFATSIKECLVLRNAVIKVWDAEDRRIQTRQFEGVTTEALAEMQQILASQGIETEIKSFDPESQDLRLKTTMKNQTLRVKSIDVANFIYREDWDSTDVQDIPFCAERHVDPRSDLISRGFSARKVDELKAFKVETKIDTRAHDLRGQRNEPPVAIDHSQDLIEWYECYVLVDRDRDGISERRRISIAGEGQNVVLEDVEVNLVPYAVGIVLINPHRLTGISLFDKLRQTQDKTTGLERALLDGVNAITRARLAYLDGKVNVEDLDSGRVNGDIRVRGSVQDVRQAISAVQIPDITQGVLANIEHQKRQRAEMGGASLDLATANMQLNDRLGSEGLDRAYSVMEELAAFMTQTVAMTLIRSTFLLAHATLRTRFNHPVRVKQHNRWRMVDPRDWPKREELTLRIAKSPNERSRMSANLKSILDSQFQLAAQELDDVLVNINGFYAALMDWARANDIPNPEKYFLDPMTPESQEALQGKRQASQEQQQLQRVFAAQAIELEQLRTAFDKYKQDTDLQFQYWERTLNSEIEEARIVGNVTADLLKQQKEQRNGQTRRSENSAAEPDTE